jgi:hypothetical protein
MITYKDIGNIDYGKYGFVKVATTQLLFSPRKLGLSVECKAFVDKNFESFGRCYYAAMVNDSHKSSSRRRRLINFIKSIYDQDDKDVALLMIKALEYFLDKLPEEELIGKIVKEVLPNAGYYKTTNSDNRYVWEIDDRKKFIKGIGKAFVITYINNRFDKDATWKYVKKHCFLKNGTWYYKNDKSEEIIEKTFLTYFKHGGIIVKEITLKEPKQFTAFIPFGKIVDDEGNDFSTLDKEAAKEKHPIIKGTASTTSVDREDERASKSFVEKMKRTGKGLPLTAETHQPDSPEKTVGVITKTGGDEDNFNIEGRLMKPSKSKMVSYILEQIATGISYGLSVGGRITKVFREYNEDLKKEALVIEDGDIYHVALTTQPANAETFGVAIRKSISEELNSSRLESGTLTYKHSSRLAKEAPAIDTIKTNDLPDIAFPSDINRKNIFKKYPHHFVSDKGMLYLHRDMLVKSFVQSIQDSADPAAINHLATHLQVIGLSKKIDELKNLSESIETISMIKQISGELEAELTEFFKTVTSVAQLQTGIDEKKNILKNVVTDVSTRLSEILEPLKEDKENGT